MGNNLEMGRLRMRFVFGVLVALIAVLGYKKVGAGTTDVLRVRLQTEGSEAIAGAELKVEHVLRLASRELSESGKTLSAETRILDEPGLQGVIALSGFVLNADGTRAQDVGVQLFEGDVANLKGSGTSDSSGEFRLSCSALAKNPAQLFLVARGGEGIGVARFDPVAKSRAMIVLSPLVTVEVPVAHSSRGREYMDHRVILFERGVRTGEGAEVSIRGGRGAVGSSRAEAGGRGPDFGIKVSEIPGTKERLRFENIPAGTSMVEYFTFLDGEGPVRLGCWAITEEGKVKPYSSVNYPHRY